MTDVLKAAVELLEKGERFALATVVQTKGSTPQKPGATLLVRQDGSAVGTLGGGCVEGDIWFATRELLQNGGDSQHREYFLNEEIAARDGLVCGGTMYFLLDPIHGPASFLPLAREMMDAYQGGRPVVLASVVKPNATKIATGTKLLVREDGTILGALGDRELESEVVRAARGLMTYGNSLYLTSEQGPELFLQAYVTPPSLVLMGGGHISKAMAPLARMLGFRLYVLDDRQQFANQERFPEADGVVAGDYATGLAQFPISPNTAIVIATRGHRYDDVALEAAVRSNAGYVGLVGSKRKVVLIFQELLKRGVPLERLLEVHSPVGLDIGARTPEEIALSIIAEIVQLRLGGTGRSMKLKQEQILKLHSKLQQAKATSAATPG